MPDDADREVARLRARVGRLEAGAWLDRLLLAVLFYFVWEHIPELAKLVGGALLGLLVVFAVVERIRARNER